MSIDAVIVSVEQIEGATRLHLGPNPARQIVVDGEIIHIGESITGQPKLDILNATWQPYVGDIIWGGSSFVIINSGGIDFPYRRQGYTKIVQSWK